jgi:hypothetical protein
MSFVNDIDREMGVKVIMYAAWVSRDGELQVSQ